MLACTAGHNIPKLTYQTAFFSNDQWSIIRFEIPYKTQASHTVQILKILGANSRPWFNVAQLLSVPPPQAIGKIYMYGGSIYLVEWVLSSDIITRLIRRSPSVLWIKNNITVTKKMSLLMIICLPVLSLQKVTNQNNWVTESNDLTIAVRLP